MKKEFVKPEITVIDFGNADIITCSGGSTPEYHCGTGNNHHNHGFNFWYWFKPWRP